MGAKVTFNEAAQPELEITTTVSLSRGERVTLASDLLQYMGLNGAREVLNQGLAGWDLEALLVLLADMNARIEAAEGSAAYAAPVPIAPCGEPGGACAETSGNTLPSVLKSAGWGGVA